MSTIIAPRKDVHHRATFWTGPVSDPETDVTGFKRFTGARTTYYAATCSCTLYGTVAQQRLTLDEAEADAFTHALTHMPAGNETTK